MIMSNRLRDFRLPCKLYADFSWLARRLCDILSGPICKERYITTLLMTKKVLLRAYRLREISFGFRLQGGKIWKTETARAPPTSDSTGPFQSQEASVLNQS